MDAADREHRLQKLKEERITVQPAGEKGFPGAILAAKPVQGGEVDLPVSRTEMERGAIYRPGQAAAETENRNGAV